MLTARPQLQEMLEELVNVANEQADPDWEVRAQTHDGTYEIVGLEADQATEVVYINLGARISD